MCGGGDERSALGGGEVMVQTLAHRDSRSAAPICTPRSQQKVTVKVSYKVASANHGRSGDASGHILLLLSISLDLTLGL